MKNKQIYKKGDRVSVQIPVEGGLPKVRFAEVISEVLHPSLLNQEKHLNIRFLDVAGMSAYQCIPQNWIVKEVIDERI